MFRTWPREGGRTPDRLVLTTAEPRRRPASGGVLLYVSPGVSVRLAPRVVAFAHVQMPLYEKVNGFQLTPRVTVSTGLQLQM